MSRKTCLRLLSLLFFGTLLFASCVPDEVAVDVDETLLYGTWAATDNTQEYWRFDSDHTGETWDESEDVQQGEGTKYNWTVSGDQLQIDLYGEMGQHVYYDYTITSQSESSFTWKTLYGDSRTFIKK